MGAIITLLGGILFYFLLFQNFTAETVHFAQDQALFLAVADSALHGEWPLLGPPSHIGGRHPGPIYYLFTTLCWWLGQGDVLKTVFFSALFQSGSALAVLYIVCSLNQGTSRVAAALGVLLTICAGSIIPTTRGMWQSNFVVLTSAVFIALCYWVLKKGPYYLPLALIGGSLLIQSHLSAGPLAFVMILSLIAFFIWNHKFKYSSYQPLSKIYLAVSIIGVIICWIPLLIYELRHPSIVSGLFSSYGKEVQGSAGFIDAVKIVYEFLFTAFLGGLGRLKNSYAAYFGFTLILIVFAQATFLSLKELSLHMRWYLFSLFLTALAYFLLLTRLTPPLYSYYLNPLLPLVALVGGLSASSWWNTLRSTSSLVTKRAWAFFLLILLFVALRGAYGNYLRYRLVPKFNIHSLYHAYKIVNAIEADNQKNERIKIFSKWHSSIMGNAYYFLLGPSYYSDLDYAERHLEIAALQRGKEGVDQFNQSYFVICPKPYSKALKKVLHGFKRRWKVSTELPLDTKECGLFRLHNSA